MANFATAAAAADQRKEDRRHVDRQSNDLWYYYLESVQFLSTKRNK